MFELSGATGYVGMFLVATLMGALGGLASELVQTRRRQTGAIELPGKIAKSRLFDLGWVASVIVGAVSALAIFYFFPPELQIVVQALDGTSQTVTKYDIVSVVALSLIAGSAGSSFLTSMQARILAAVSTQQLRAQKEIVDQELKNLSAGIQADTEEVINAVIKDERSVFSEELEQARAGWLANDEVFARKVASAQDGDAIGVLEERHNLYTPRSAASLTLEWGAVDRKLRSRAEEAVRDVRGRIERRITAASAIVAASSGTTEL